jgi:hypothetical protein
MQRLKTILNPPDEVLTVYPIASRTGRQHLEIFDMRIIVAATFTLLATHATATAQDRTQFSCTQAAAACAQYYPQWASSKCAQAATQCNKSPKGGGFCYFNAPDGKGSGLRRCG